MQRRKIIHVDMDAFFASVEQRDAPELRGQPVIVGGKPESRGVVAACSYEARRFGIHSAMPCARAFRLCPHAVFVPPRFEVYREVSAQIHAVFHRFARQVEPLSLDEAYLDVSDTPSCEGSATLMAKQIKSQILSETALTASAGVSYNKFLAKVASDMDKPNGLTVIRPEQGEAFVAGLPVGRFFGVGKVTEARMHALGIYKGSDLRGLSLAELQQHFGRSAAYYYQIARGVDDRPVEPRRGRKSSGKETTFAEDLADVATMLDTLNHLAEVVGQTLEDKSQTAQTLTIKVKYADFQQVTRSISPETGLSSVPQMQSFLPHLLEKTEVKQRAVRLLGVSLSGFEPRCEERALQLTLFEPDFDY
ncbi:MAG: DNA polymerase IV [bacterium]